MLAVNKREGLFIKYKLGKLEEEGTPTERGWLVKRPGSKTMRLRWRMQGGVMWDIKWSMEAGTQPWEALYRGD